MYASYKDLRKGQKAHMSCDSYWYFASSPCSACNSLHGYHWGLSVTVIIRRRQILPGALGVHTLCFTSSCAASGSSSTACLSAELQVLQEGHLPRWSPDTSHKHFRETDHGALKEKIALAQCITELCSKSMSIIREFSLSLPPEQILHQI